MGFDHFDLIADVRDFAWSPKPREVHFKAILITSHGTRPPTEDYPVGNRGRNTRAPP